MVGMAEKVFFERKLSLFDSTAGATDHGMRCTSGLLEPDRIRWKREKRTFSKRFKSLLWKDFAVVPSVVVVVLAVCMLPPQFASYYHSNWNRASGG